MNAKKFFALLLSALMVITCFAGMLTVSADEEDKFAPTNEELIELYDGLTPTNAPAVGPRYLGSVTPDMNLDGFDLTPGKKYDVYLIGANDITLRSGNGEALFTDNDGKREKIGTVSQTFDLGKLGLSASLFDETDKTQYIALHFLFSFLNIFLYKPASRGNQNRHIILFPTLEKIVLLVAEFFLKNQNRFCHA